jgi:hypothetical protein
LQTSHTKAQIARINRRLAKRYEKLRASRGWRKVQNLGDNYVLDSYMNAVVRTHVNLDSLAAELGVAAC